MRLALLTPEWYAADGAGVHPPIEEPNPLASEATLAGV
jgi:hypothetical protein